MIDKKFILLTLTLVLIFMAPTVIMSFSCYNCKRDKPDVVTNNIEKKGVEKNEK